MPASTPTLGYPSKRAAVRALREKGMPTRDIGKRLGLTSRQVRHHFDGRAVVNFPRDIISMLEVPATRRDMSVSGLAIALVSTAVLDGLIDAILDDR